MDDRDLSTLLHDAVSDVEPTDRLAEIRQRVSPRRRRLGRYAAGGGLLAAAAAVTAIAVVTTQTAPQANDPGPVAPPPTSVPAPTTTPTGPTVAAGIYYVGDTPSGPRLYREFRRVPKNDPLAALALVGEPASDPDYRTLWPAGSLVDAGFDGIGADGFFSVSLADADLAARPAGMSEQEAQLAIQSVVYTLQAGTKTPARVEFYGPGGGAPLDSVLGVDADRDLQFSGVRSFDRAPELDVLSWMSISNPREGRTVDGSFTADGVASSFEGNVLWTLQATDNTVVREGYATAGMDPNRLIPWETEPIDVSDLAPGTYTFVASTSDPSDGEGAGVFTDTRTIVVE